MNIAMSPELHSSTVTHLIYQEDEIAYNCMSFILPDDSVDEENNLFVLIY